MVHEWWGLVDYEVALARQRERREAVIGGFAPNALYFVEHPPVITTGRRAVALDAEGVFAAGFSLVHTERGGLATCHEPGQLVGYLIANVREIGVRRTVCALEGGIIAWLGRYGVEAQRRAGLPGVWVGEGKIASIGLHLSRGVTMHGLALNLVNSLEGFRLVVPCGITNVRIVALSDLIAGAPTPSEAWPGLAAEVAKSFAHAVATLDTGGCRE